MLEPVLMKLGTYIMAPEPVSTAYFINPSHHFVYYLLIAARQRLGERVPAAKNTRKNERTVGRVALYAVRVVPK
jgi:hypothetical protein